MQNDRRSMQSRSQSEVSRGYRTSYNYLKGYNAHRGNESPMTNNDREVTEPDDPFHKAVKINSINAESNNETVDMNLKVSKNLDNIDNSILKTSIKMSQTYAGNMKNLPRLDGRSSLRNSNTGAGTFDDSFSKNKIRKKSKKASFIKKPLFNHSFEVNTYTGSGLMSDMID